jgi:hypothetical protein
MSPRKSSERPLRGPLSLFPQVVFHWPGLAVRELQPLVLPQPHGRRDVAVVRTVDDQVVHVLERRELRGRLVLAVGGRDRHDGFDGEVEVEALLEIVRVVLELVERRGHRRGLAASRMPHEREVRHVHAMREGPVGRLVELLPGLEVLEQQPGAAIRLAGEPAVDEVFVH